MVWLKYYGNMVLMYYILCHENKNKEKNPQGQAFCFQNYKAMTRPCKCCFASRAVVIKWWQKCHRLKKHEAVSKRSENCFITSETRHSSLSSLLCPGETIYFCFIITAPRGLSSRPMALNPFAIHCTKLSRTLVIKN